MALRQEPRRYVAYDYIGCESWQSQYLRMFAYKSGTQLIELPLWHAATLLEDHAYEGQTTLRIPTEAMWSFRNIGSVELWRDDKRGGGKYEIKYLAANGVMGLKNNSNETTGRILRRSFLYSTASCRTTILSPICMATLCR